MYVEVAFIALYHILLGLKQATDSYLRVQGPIYRDKIKAIALLQPPVEQGDVLDFDLTQFLRLKARSWETSQAEIDTLVASPDIDDSATINTKLKKMEVNDDETRITDDTTDSSETVMQRKVICPTYSSGVERWEELILSKVYLRVLDFFQTFV